MKKHTAKKQFAMGLWIVGLALLGSAHAAVVGIDSDWSTTGDLDGWFPRSETTPVTLTNSAGYLSATGPASSYRYAARNVDGGSLALGVGESMSLSFDIARDASVVGQMRVYLMNNTTDLDSYMFATSFGEPVTTRMGFLKDKYPVAYPTTTYDTVAALDVVGTNIVSDFDTFEFTVDRIDADTLVFNLYKNGGASLLSVTKNYDGVDQPVADLLTSFGRVYIGWSDALEAGESIQIDNVKLQITEIPPAEIDSDWSTIGDLDGWFPKEVTLANTAGYLSATGPANGYRYAARSVDNWSLSLDVGSIASLSFDIARDAAVGGELRVYLMNNTTDVDSYMFRASLGASIDTRMGFVNNKYPVAYPTTTYKTGANADVVGTNIVSDFDTFEFTVEQIDADTLAFEVLQNGGLLLVSTNDFDDVDQPAADLLTSFGRVYIGWTHPLLEGESIQIDNVKFQTVSPIPEATYDVWADSFSLAGADRDMGADLEPDGMNNLLEYALGGNPNSADADTKLPAYATVELGGTNWLVYVHNQRTDAAERNLEYNVQSTANLAIPSWTNGSPMVYVGTSVPGSGFESVTNAVDTDSGTEYFLRLNVQQN